MSETKVRRIKQVATAGSSKQEAGSSKQKKAKAKSQKAERQPAPAWLLTLGKPFFAIGRYVAGAGEELKQTRWPNRKATWGLTIAVILFSAFFATIILLADQGFQQLLELILRV